MGILKGYTLFTDAFKDNVKKYADKEAVFDEASSLTYKELDKITDLLTEKMILLGIKKGDFILVYAPRCKEVLVAAIASFKAGFVYVPADASYPAERINYMKEDSKARCILTTRTLWNEKPLKLKFEKLVFLDEIDINDSLNEKIIFPTISTEDPAFVVYTSGSTGNPKGVLHNHQSLYYIANWHPDTEILEDENCRSCHIAGFSFVQGMIDLFSALMFGGSTVIFSEETRHNTPVLYEKLLEYKVTCFNTSTRLAVLMLENYDMRSLKVRMGGEKINGFKPLFKTKVTEIYGSSEGSMICTADLIGNENPMPLGKPCEGVGVMLIDDDLKPVVGVGKIGEFTFSGPNVAVEYLNLPSLNKEKWFMHDGKRWFRTGDLAYVDENGMYYYVQRKDYMIKLRGYRIEPGEVEKQVINASSEKIKSAVCVLKNVSGEDRLCCYFEAEEKIDINELKDKLSKVLSEYLVPEIFIQLEALPKNLNGKLDRSALPNPEATEEEILTSLGIMRLAAKCYEKYGITIEYEELAKAGSKEKMMALIEKRKSEAKLQSNSNDGNEYEMPETAPLCFSQIGVYADCIANPKSLMYNLPVYITMPTYVNHKELEKAIIKIIKAHSYINVRFETTNDGKVIQQMHKLSDNFRIPYKKLSNIEFGRIKAKEIHPFKLDGSEPLYRFKIFETEMSLYLFADFHHLIFDGSSFACFIKDLKISLRGGVVNKEKFSGMNLALEQQKLQESPSYNELHEFWKSRLSILDTATYVLPDIYNKSEKVGNEAVIVRPIDSNVVRSMAKKNGIKQSGIYLAALFYTLSVYTGDDAIGIVTISNGRHNVKLANNYGMFVNTLPITSTIPEGSIINFVKNMQKIFDEAIINESYPYASISKEFGYRPNIMFAYQEDLLNENVKIDFNIENMEKGSAKFPLYFSVTGHGDAILLELRYDKNKYSYKFMKRMLYSYWYYINQFCNCDTLEKIHLCDDIDSSILDSFSSKTLIAKETENIVSMFKKAVKEYPENNAVVFKDKTLTYSELDEITDRLAKYIETNILEKNTSNHEPIVSILVNRGINMPICAIAALKAGCAYQPLDPSYPEERISYMISDAEPVMLIADTSCLSLVKFFDGHILKTEDIVSIPEISEPLKILIKPENLFILLYTSGSTGKPKGVMLEHQNLVAFCHWYKRYFNLLPEHKVASYASFGFDACMMDFYPALTTGACVYIVPEEIRLNLIELNSYFEKNNITHAFMTTQVGVNFHQTQNNHSLKHLITGGEKIISVTPNENYIIYNGYGPTECTIFSTIKPIMKYESNIPIGRPVDSLKCNIVDKKMRCLPVGAVGELILYGNQVGRGYLNLPEKTVEAFFMEKDVRAYKTGDIVRYRSNGDIEFVGRKDGQVKIRGFRIELKEVEAIIREFDGIKDVTVQAFENPDGGKFLVAYIVCDDSLKISDLKSYILSKKPSYMLPSSFVKIKNIPLNVNQKVDRKALPDPDFSEENEYVELETENEQIVADAIARVTGVKHEISAVDSFTSLGGDSINALRLSTELAKSQLEITPNLILQLDIVREIAKAVTSTKKNVDKKDNHFTGDINNSAIVQYFYNLKLLKPEHFNQALLYKACSLIDRDLLYKSFDILVKHHDMLRAVSSDNHLYIKEASCEQLFTLTEDTIDDFTRKANILQSSFDLKNGPLIKACVFHAEKIDYLLIVIHHLVIDGVSWRILTEDLNKIYGELSLKKEGNISLPMLSDSYAKYVDVQIRFKKSLSLISQKLYWDNIREHIINMSYSDRSKGLPSFEKIEFNIDSELTKNVLSKNNINNLFLTAVGLSYHLLTGENSLSIELEGHGREVFSSNLNIDRTIGWFTSIYPVILEHLDLDLPKVIRKTKEIMRRIPQKGIGYGPLYDYDLQHLPLLTFNYLGKMSENINGALFTISEDYSVGDTIAPENRYGTDINLNGILIGESIKFVLDYNNIRYTSSQMEKFIDGFISSLKQIVSYLQSTPEIELTPSDFNEYEWTDEEFDLVVKDFAKRNEKIYAIFPMTRSMFRDFNKSILSKDNHADMIHVPLDIEGKFTYDDFFDILTRLYVIYEELRYAIAFHGVSKPRIIKTDRKPKMLYYDFSSEKDSYKKMIELQEELSYVSIDLQRDALMQLAIIKTNNNKYGLFFSFHNVLFNLSMARIRIDDFLRLLNEKASTKTNISMWRDLMHIGMICELSTSSNEKMPIIVEGGSLSSDCEYVIAEMFEVILDVDVEMLTEESDFLKLGGDEYLCVQLSDLILEVYGKVIPPVVLLENSTIKSIALLIESGNISETNEDIHIYSDNPGKKHLFFVHTGNTGSEVYYKLAKHLEKDFSFAVLEQYNINHINNPKKDVCSLATEYIKIIKKIQPEGPYNLGGWCFGGTVAYEMARQLTLAQESVEKLVMLDSHIVESDELREKIIKSSLEHSREYLTTAPLFEDIRKKGLIEKYIENSERSTNLWLYYDPPKYEGSVLYFKASIKQEGLASAYDELYNVVLKQKAAGYEKRIPADKLKIVEIPKEHDFLMDDDALELIVPIMKDYLNEDINN